MSLFAELSTGMIALLAVAGFAVLVLFYFIGIYNTLVSLRNRYKNAFAQIDVQLKRRNDLIPNLVEVAKGYMKHEKETLEAVIAARNQAATAGQRAAEPAAWRPWLWAGLIMWLISLGAAIGFTLAALLLR